eukprot:TRINITY_DN4128_c0_g1_i3.p1 TRINITY_DN4128_c0_g1~~TRINITY_DN4128_c0_g1_i3.p1  ORF type:complete len:438 (+),score=93.10 TRINITY_DN4128_c0_g1_i3:66-1316(+)
MSSRVEDSREENRKRDRETRDRDRHRESDDRRRSRSRSTDKRRDYNERRRRSPDRRDRDRHRDDDDRRRRSPDRRDRDRDDDKKRDDDRRKDNHDKPVVSRKEDKVEQKVKEGEMKERPMAGVYIPPFKLAAMRAAMDKSSAEYQRMTWDALKKSINGLVNKVSVSNIQNIVMELFRENLVRGRGLLCRSLMRAQHGYPDFSNVYSALVAIINTKMPENGELLLKRLVEQFKRAHRRNDKAVCISTSKFIAHLTNQQICGVILPLELLTFVLHQPSEENVEISVEFMKSSGQILSELSPKGVNVIFERLRAILHEGNIDIRVQYMIENLYTIRRTKWAEFPGVPEGLDLVDEDDQITHDSISLESVYDVEEGLNYFKADPEFAVTRSSSTKSSPSGTPGNSAHFVRRIVYKFSIIY